jgi:5-bromo-4-chloroindolyl phosphate hydrolysis protein
MKIFILIFIMFIVSIIVILKLVTSPEPLTSPDISSSDPKEYNAGRQTYQNNIVTSFPQSTKSEISSLKLMAFARAFAEVQSYMNKAGSKANYKETRKIVHDHGLSVEDYTMIATLINENPDFRKRFQKLINEAK